MNYQIMKNIEACRLCKNKNLQTVISLGEQYITSRFPTYGDWNFPKTNIDLCVCENCRLLQLLQTTNSSEMYEHEYGYRSGISNTMRSHLKEYQKEVSSLVILNKGDTVVDIGSNDCTTLNYYSDELRKIGVDPTGKQFNQYYKTAELLPTYFTLENFRNAFGNIKCKVVSSISMFYDLPDPVQFAKDIYDILDDDGIWTCEQSYLLSMLKTNSIDTICHEHLEYYALYQIKLIADMVGFKIFKISFNNCNGGSFRLYFSKKENSKFTECTDIITNILNEEKEYGLLDNSVFKRFMKSCNDQVEKLKLFIETVNKNNKKIYIYGASTKGNCLLQYANITETDISLAVERNIQKVGKMTNTGIRIISEEEMRENPPDFLLVLPWHFKNEIIEREQEFLNRGGQFIFPFPNFEVISKKEKVLITGCEGMIANYVKQEFLEDSCLYGIGKNVKSLDNNILKFECNLLCESQLEKIITSINPEKIIHLAGISSSSYAFQNPLETIKVNGVATASLCDIIFRNKLHCKLFNASSSEIYKGHINYDVKENDTHMFHIHPYSIAKTLGHNIVKFYRETYNLPFSNGIIFTTESYLKGSNFLLNKIALYIKNIQTNFYKLKTGNLDSYRSILHASDVAKAIKLILNNTSNDFNICSDESYKIVDLVIKLFNFCNINLHRQENYLVDNTGNIYIEIEDKYNGQDSCLTKLTGNNDNIKKIGWKQIYGIDEILLDILNNH